MHRRTYLAALGTAVVGTSAGCLGQLGTTSGGGSTSAGAGTGTTPAPTTTTIPLNQVTLPVPNDQLEWRLSPDAIPAIVDPVFGRDWGEVPPSETWDSLTLSGDSAVIGVERDGAARAYPLNILDWHEVVNDTFGGPLLVTYCPLCGSAIVAERRVGGQETLFGVLGALWRNDLVLYDRLNGTESRWSQLLATAIQGPHTGDTLELFPSTLTTWDEWQRLHPGTTVLLPPPVSGTIDDSGPIRDYSDSKYGYDGEQQVVGYDSGGAGRLLVVGVVHDDTPRAYPFDVVREAGVVNDTIGSLPVVVALAPGGTMVAYDRRVDGQTLTFTARDERTVAAGGSTWDRQTGRARDGPHEGTTLTDVAAHEPLFWSAWRDFYPGTEVYGGAIPTRTPQG